MKRALAALALAAACAVAGPPAVRAQAPAAASAVTERSIKAAYLCKFAGYVEWPPSHERAAGTPLTIGVLESDDMADELARITEGRTINDREVRIRRLAPGESLAGIDVLFVGARDAARAGELLDPAAGLPILTVTEARGGLASGSVINFTLERDRVRFEVSLPAAERNQLRLSARLLAVAQRVQRVAEAS